MVSMQSFRGRISGDEEWKALRGETGKTAGCAVPTTDTATATATATVSALAPASSAPGAVRSDSAEDGRPRTLSRIDIPFTDDDDDDDNDNDSDGYSKDGGITDKGVAVRGTVIESESDTTKPSLEDEHTEIEIERGMDSVVLKFIALGGERAAGGVPFDSTQYLWSVVEALTVAVGGEQVWGDLVDGRRKDIQLATTTTSATTSIPSSTSTSTSADLSIEAAVARITSIQQTEDKRFHRSSVTSSSRPPITTIKEMVSPSAALLWQHLRVSEIAVYTGEDMTCQVTVSNLREWTVMISS
jgi:hypothetical protein